MNISKFTQKSVEAVQNCEKLAYEYGNQEIEAGTSSVQPSDHRRQPDLKADREDGNPEGAFCGHVANRR